MISNIIIIILLSLLIITYVRLWKFNTNFGEIIPIKQPISELYDTMKTGDIIFMTSTALSAFLSMSTQGYFSHCGMIVDIDGILHLSESQSQDCITPIDKPYNESQFVIKLNKGTTLTPLLTKLKYYSGNYYYSKLSKELSKNDIHKLTNLINHINGYQYPTHFQSILKHFGVDSSTRHCYQHLLLLLKCIGMNEEVKNSNKSLSKFFDTIFEKKYSFGYYHNPIQINYDI